MSPSSIGSIYILVACLSFSAHCHEAIEAQILLLDKQLLETPGEYRLYLRRADLYRRHQEWNLAIRDFSRAEQMEPGNYASILGRAQLELDRQRPDACIQILEGLIQSQPDLAQVHFVHGRALSAMNKPLEAAKAYTRGIDLLSVPRPDHYLERARLLASDPKHISDAIRSIDDGLDKLKHNISLEQFAVELEIGSGLYGPALTRIERVLNTNQPLPSWLVRKADVLADLGRYEESIKAYQAASERIASLPTRRQYTPAMLILKTRIAEGKKSVEKQKL